MGDLRVLFKEILNTISLADHNSDTKLAIGYKNGPLNYRESLSPERDHASFVLNYKLASLGVKIEESLFHRFGQSYHPLSRYGIHNDKLSIQSTILRLFDRLDSKDEESRLQNREDGFIDIQKAKAQLDQIPQEEFATMVFDALQAAIDELIPSPFFKDSLTHRRRIQHNVLMLGLKVYTALHPN